MTPQDGHRAEPTEIEDNAVHVPNPDTDKAGGTQIAIVAIAIVVILSIFFYGVNNQRDETAGPQTASTSAGPINAGGSSPAPQAASDQKPPQQGNTAQSKEAPAPGNAEPATTGQGAAGGGAPAKQ